MSHYLKSHTKQLLVMDVKVVCESLGFSMAHTLQFCVFTCNHKGDSVLHHSLSDGRLISLLFSASSSKLHEKFSCDSLSVCCNSWTK
jgi:hypothetical protein